MQIVCKGEIVSLIGRNGAGKSTTMRSLMGLTKAREGVVRIFGQTTTQLNSYRIAPTCSTMAMWCIPALPRNLPATRSG